LKDFVLYCKSYSRDFLRLKRLLDSIGRFNIDKLPFYISTPQSDKALLVEILGEDGYIWMADEEIVAAAEKSQGKIGTRLTPKGANEPKGTNIVSPTAQPKRNKYGV
jgi:hypothetical protein